MEYAVVVHKAGVVEKVIAPFANKLRAQEWAGNHVVKGNNWSTCEYILPPLPKPAPTPPPTTD